MYYAIEVWGGSFDSHLLKLEQIIVDGMRLVTGATARSNIANLYLETSWQSFAERRDGVMLVMIYKVKNNLAPNYLTELLPHENQNEPTYNLRNKKNLKLPMPKKELVRRSFLHTADRIWNNLIMPI